MSKYSTFETKFRSSSPQYLTQQTSDSSNFYEKQRELIHQQISQLPNSPRSKRKIEQTFEEMLKSVHFFRKPDIIPFPYLNLDHPHGESTETPDTGLKDLQDELEKERNLRKAAEKENEALKDRLAYLTDIERQYEEYRLKSLKLSELNLEVEKLNGKIRVLLDENEDLRRKIRGGYENNLNLSRLQKDLEKEKERNSELLKKLNEANQAYEDLRRAYAKDIHTQKELFDKLYNEKIQLEVRMREMREKPTRLVEPYDAADDEMQLRIRNMKHEYKDKLKKLEQKLDPEKPDNKSENRLKEIEDRLANLQGKLAEQTGKNRHPVAGSQTSRGSTPIKERNSPLTTWKSSSRFSPQRMPRAGNSVPELYPTHDRVLKHGVNDKNRSPSRGKASVSPKRPISSASKGSPLRNNQSSPAARSASRNRLYEQQHECETCIRRHGHEWARSPGKSKNN